MKKLVCLLLTLTGMAHADCCPYFAGVEATFLYPCIPDLYFAVRGTENTVSSGQPIGHLRAVKPDFTPGFYAWLGTPLCGGKWDVRVGWQYLHTRDSRRLTTSGNEVIWPCKNSPELDPDAQLFNATAYSRVKFDFDTADLEMSTYKGRCNRLMLKLAGSLRYAMIGYRNEIFYAGNISLGGGAFESSLFNESSWAWGLGPRLAADLHYCICGNFGIRGLAGVGLLAGQISNTANHRELFDNGNPSNERILEKGEYVCNLMPMIETKLGIEYCRTCGCGTLNFSAGYQVARYFSAVQRTYMTDDVNPSAYVMTNTSLDLTGFYVGAEFAY